MQPFLTVLAVLVIIAAFIPLIRTDAWWVISFDFPRAQFFLLGLIVMLAILTSRSRFAVFDYGLLGLLLFGLFFLVYRIYPYTSLARKQVRNSTKNEYTSTITMLCSNVLQHNRKAAQLIELIEQKEPDVVLVVETDQWWVDALEKIESSYPYQLKRPLDNTYGMLLYSRLKIISAEIKYLIEEGIPSVFAEVSLPGGRIVELIGIHPKPPRPDKLQSLKTRDAELLIVAKYVAHAERPVIVMGDFNDVAWSHTTRLFQRISGLLDPRRGRGFFNTFHADYPFLRYPLDHIFHSRHFAVQAIERLSHIGSDHFPVFASLCLENTISQQAFEADTLDDKEAKKIIRKAFE